MKILLVSEGNNELGGSLKTLVQRLLAIEIDAEAKPIRELHADHGKGHRFFKKAIRWMRYAEEHGFEGVVIVIDQDNEPDRRKQFSAAQNNQLTSVARGLGVAVKTYDAWMLADQKALTVVLGMQVGTQSSPEKMKDPKGICNQLCEEAEFTEGLSALYARLSEHIDIATLESRCPDGFQPFSSRLRQMR